MWEPFVSNERGPSPLPPVDLDLEAIEMGPGVVRCYTCGHPVHAHFTSELGAGCVAFRPPQQTIGAAVRGHQRKPLVGDAGCLCPGWVRGEIPHALTKHMTPLTEDDDASCQQCEHRLIDHSDDQGCHFCPCTVHDLQTTGKER